MKTMQMRTTTDRSEKQPKQKQVQQPERTQQPCSICSGQLVMDAEGAALFCDECWDRKWFLALESD